jgi:hypothetical protein
MYLRLLMVQNGELITFYFFLEIILPRKKSKLVYLAGKMLLIQELPQQN